MPAFEDVGNLSHPRAVLGPLSVGRGSGCAILREPASEWASVLSHTDHTRRVTASWMDTGPGAPGSLLAGWLPVVLTDLEASSRKTSRPCWKAPLGLVSVPQDVPLSAKEGLSSWTENT